MADLTSKEVLCSLTSRVSIFSSGSMRTAATGDSAESFGKNSDFIAFVTRGPNRRKDFHINPGDEIFYQLEGELNLHYLGKDGKAGARSLEGRGPVSFTGQCSPLAAARRWLVDLRCRENTPAGGAGPFCLDLRRMPAIRCTRPPSASTIPQMPSPKRRLR